jgi:hypothetical protein
MQGFLGVYTNRFNHRHKEFGHLFSGRYKALHVDGSGSGYTWAPRGMSRAWLYRREKSQAEAGDGNSENKLF